MDIEADANHENVCSFDIGDRFGLPILRIAGNADRAADVVVESVSAGCCVLHGDIRREWWKRGRG